MPSCWRTCNACTEADALPMSASTMAPRPVVVASTTALTKFDCSCSVRVSAALVPSTALTVAPNVVSEVSAAVAAVTDDTEEAAKAVKAVLTVEPELTVIVEADVSDKKVLAPELFDSKFTPLYFACVMKFETWLVKARKSAA
jgi:hypothetical protein